MINVLLLIAGLGILILGAEIFVNSGVDIAKKLKIPSVIIALTIISIGTSAPELVISTTAALKGNSMIAMSNITGTNIFNILFIVGIGALIKPIVVKTKEMLPEILLMTTSLAVFLSIMLILPIIGGGHVPQFVGILMMAGFIAFLVILIFHALNGRREHDNITHRSHAKDDHPRKPMPTWLAILGLIFGCVIIVAGGELTVETAKKIAEGFGVSERIVALAIVAPGTSLPELIIVIMACIKRESGMAFGAVAGTNIFNFLFILGLSAAITPLPTDGNLIFDLAVLTIVTIIAMIFALTRKTINRIEGGVMIGMYAAYMTYILIK